MSEALDRYLAHNHWLPLKRVPDAWCGCAFYHVTAGALWLALAADMDEAREGAARYLGTGDPIVSVGDPQPFLYASLGYCAYIDCTLVLHGDPCTPALRGPCSSPALDRELAFLDAAHTARAYASKAPSPAVARSMMGRNRRWDRMHERRMASLTRAMIEPSDEDPGLRWDGERWS